MAVHTQIISQRIFRMIYFWIDFIAFTFFMNYGMHFDHTSSHLTFEGGGLNFFSLRGRSFQGGGLAWDHLNLLKKFLGGGSFLLHFYNIMNEKSEKSAVFEIFSRASRAT